MYRVVLSMIAFVFGLFGCLGLVQAQESARYTVLMMGKPAGAQTTVVKPDGLREFTFEYNDRGRGPKLTSRFKIDADGLPVSVETTGNDYMKGPVNETLKVVDGVARWHSAAESGEKKLAGRAFYVSIYGPPEELGLLAQALLKSPDKRLPLLPDGEAAIARTGELSIKTGEKTRRVISFEISGLGFTPYTIWLEEDNAFFASVSSWMSFIRDGWESTAPLLLKKQDEMEAARTLRLAQTLARKPNTPLAFTNANLFDSETGRTLSNMTVLIEGNRIKAIGQGNSVNLPKNTEIIDARGGALLPGLWDMHVHIGPNDGLMHLAAGVTSVRDLANENDALQTLKRKIEANEELGPRIMMSGFMDGRGPYAGPTKVFVDTEEEARKRSTITRSSVTQASRSIARSKLKSYRR